MNADAIAKATADHLHAKVKACAGDTGSIVVQHWSAEFDVLELWTSGAALPRSRVPRLTEPLIRSAPRA
jgi:hypothetical protein